MGLAAELICLVMHSQFVATFAHQGDGPPSLAGARHAASGCQPPAANA